MTMENPRQTPALQSMDTHASTQFAQLSPLDQIRQIEAEETRKLVQARESAGKIIQEARHKVAQTLQQACTAGEQEGQARYKEMLKKSEDEATALVAEARQQADRLRQSGKSQMEALVERIVKFVTGMEEGI